MFRTSITSKLELVSRDLQRVREELRVIDEQVHQLSDEADEARLRSLVSETPQASQDHRQAAKALAVAQRDQEGKLKRLEKLEGKMNSLLDRMSSETIAKAMDSDRQRDA